MKHKVVVSLFDKTGTAVQSWADAGYQCVLFDTQHPSGFATLRDRITTVNCDLSIAQPTTIRDLVASAIRAKPDDQIEVAFVFCFVPCTHLAVSGARWMKGKGLRALASSIHLFATAADYCEYTGAPYLIENPVSTISTYWRKPDHTFHPWQYSGLESDDCYTKKTCLWTGGGFRMPKPYCDPDCKPDDRIHKAPPSPERANFRSATPRGFARAVFIANTPHRLIESLTKLIGDVDI